MKNKDIALTDAQRSMVEANMDVVRWAIRTSIQVNEQRYGFGYDDLFQEGCIWLCKAAVTYDPDGGASFPTYAQRVVENGLRTYCRLQRSKELRSFPVSEIFDTEADNHRAMASGIRSLQEQLAEVDALSLLEAAIQRCRTAGYRGDAAEIYRPEQYGHCCLLWRQGQLFGGGRR